MDFTYTCVNNNTSEEITFRANSISNALMKNGKIHRMDIVTIDGVHITLTNEIISNLSCHIRKNKKKKRIRKKHNSSDYFLYARR